MRGALCTIFCAAQLGAQKIPVPVASAADVAIATGRLEDAEQLLFAASSRATHEPSARGALGMYLASRGRLRIGTVLLEEARQFGGDPQEIDARLARIYPWLGDWAALAALKHYAISGPEHDRARWLAAHATTVGGADSVVATIEPNDVYGLGRIVLLFQGAPMPVDIDPSVDGLVLPSSPVVTGASEQFGMRDSSTVAVVREFAIGTLRFSNVRARLAPAARPAIGLDVLAILEPTFDIGAHRLTLRRKNVAIAGDSMAVLLGFPGVRVVPRAGSAPVALESAAGRAALRGVPWTFDFKRGAIVR
ncbi:MAG TPA: hypothetical protein VGQ30_03265 [Gemmatimonadaceae bacterium]|jgi:hypothetical protein|nr:hypothetical protein [Gemmatimonadaceae bacterium]